ncbi:lantibiotic dehydratase, partial [Streptomyces sp. NPDC032472]|uniref:lantibiotic dehydratase n=1 Tax=Streptomyces sp. NPDC032472 TaxID=3155018 RepID=UPI00340F0F33
MPHPAQPAAPRRVAPARTAPYVLVRTTVAAHPAEPAEAARVRTLIGRLADLAAREAALRPALCDDLFASRGGHPEEFHRQVVLPLRRALHNGRTPRPALLARLDDLPARIPWLGDWLALHESRAAVLAGLAEATPAALAAERAALAELCRSPGFARAVALTSADLLRAVSRAAREEGGRRARKEEPSVLRHALRASTKTSPLSWFTAVGWSDGTTTAPAEAAEATAATADGAVDDPVAAPDGAMDDPAAAGATASSRPHPGGLPTDPAAPAGTVPPVGQASWVGQMPAAGPMPAKGPVPPVNADSPVGAVSPVPPLGLIPAAGPVPSVERVATAAAVPPVGSMPPSGPMPAVGLLPPTAAVPPTGVFPLVGPMPSAGPMPAVGPVGLVPLAGPVPSPGAIPPAGPVPSAAPVSSSTSGPSADTLSPAGPAPLVGLVPSASAVQPAGTVPAGPVPQSDAGSSADALSPMGPVPSICPFPPADPVSQAGPVLVGSVPPADPAPLAASRPSAGVVPLAGPAPLARPVPPAGAAPPTGPAPLVDPVPSADAVSPVGPVPSAGPMPAVGPGAPAASGRSAGAVQPIGPAPLVGSVPSAGAVSPAGAAPLVGPGSSEGVVPGAGSAVDGLRGVVRENRALVAALSAALLDEPRRRRALPHRLTSSARPTADGRARYVRDRTVFAGGRYLVTHEEEIELAARPALASLTGIAATPAPLDALAARLAPVLGRPAADPAVGRFVDRLADSGLLVPVEPVAPQDPAPLRALARWLRQWPEDTGLADRIDLLAADTARFARARAEARPGLLDGLAERWRVLLADAGRPVPADAAPLNVLSEDVVVAGPPMAEPGVRGDGRP